MEMSDEYNLDFFREEGLIRKQCSKCGGFFWTRDRDRTTCGDAPCDEYTFVGSPVLKEMSLTDMREYYLSYFERHGHTRVGRYPVIARWRDDVFLTGASIYDFQPFVTSGTVPPPANPLTISQPCIRLGDLDSVGRSGRHLTTFEMMAHHAFNTRDNRVYWKDETVRLCDDLLIELGAEPKAITYKENPWAGGGNAGPCVEVLMGGLELATLVFMDMKIDPNGPFEIKGNRYRKMDMSIVDTGYGLERFVWASNGAPTIYDAIFPEVVKEIMSLAGLEHSIDDPEYSSILSNHARLSGIIDIKGNESLMELHGKVAEKIGVPAEKLHQLLEPVENVYAITDHTRCLAFMLGDGIIPSNVKAGYLARLVLRRVLRMMRKLGIEASLSDLVELQIRHMDIYPEIEERLDTITEILQLEEERYAETLRKGTRLVEKLVDGYRNKEESVPLDSIIDLYDTHGIPPEIAGEIAVQKGARVNIPDNFYSLVAEKHSSRVHDYAQDPMVAKVVGLPRTKKSYYEDTWRTEFEAKVIGVIDNYLVLDHTLFYPEGGGQPADYGHLITADKITLNVDNAIIADGVILHHISNESELKRIKKGDVITGIIDIERRKAHARHHTATHIILDSAKAVLGEHVWQGGAQKGVDRARLDISHFKRITPAEVKQVELEANRRVMDNVPVLTGWKERGAAESEQGFVLYQGGVPPGEQIRVVQVGKDVQACAGTHCRTTGEIGAIKILHTERIQDGVERIEFSAGVAAIERMQENDQILADVSAILRVPAEKLPETSMRFFDEWKGLKKEVENLRNEMARLERARPPEPVDIAGFKFIHSSFENMSVKQNLEIAPDWSSSTNGIVWLGSITPDGLNVVVSVPDEYVRQGIDAREIANASSMGLGGGGGGKPTLAQGGGPKHEKSDLEAALKAAIEVIEKKAAGKKSTEKKAQKK